MTYLITLNQTKTVPQNTNNREISSEDNVKNNVRNIKISSTL